MEDHMPRYILALVCAVSLAAPGWATSFRNVPLPELVGRADVIVIGTVLNRGNLFSLKVTETLVGTPPPKVEFLVPRWFEFHPPAEGQTGFFFLVSREGKLIMPTPSSSEPLASAEKVRLLVDMRT